ncbi:MAG: DNA polymerase III subunit alpha [Elusimicrobia bacterium RIFCSPLOWO2_01_FULL_64_13]|nr:MAG: DNA polymerase III subunit alpha [Elusimicrobia bacterium RIFCSPHIGHO2_01_FULL_64_10]OGR98094.1 MAG: DNA polymerase III subunit alpha [Elusimicrobia bacterium RIFCSPLOWO2_01_FULL_64_13]
MPNTPQFVHLHAHTEYSLLDGACRIVDDKGKPSELIRWVASHKMPALAMTDHGNLHGAIEFYGACQQEGVKPILGMEAYVAPGSRTDRTGAISASNNHLTLLARNEAGFRNLMKLTSLSYLEGYYYKPRVDWELLEKHREGLIALSGCLKGKLAETILSGKPDEAMELAGRWQEIFGKGGFYLEVMDHGIDKQKEVARALAELSKKTGIPLVATNDCHYLKKDDAFAHDVLLCIGTGRLLSDANRMRYATEEFYYKSPQEMAQVFAELPEALRSTVEIASQCNVELKFDRMLLPEYSVPQGESLDSYLEKLCLDGIRKRYGQTTPELKNRLDSELGTIRKMGFAAYFLIVWDFIRFARSEGIPVGPGRGSGAGSLVSYALEITHIDPIRYGLLFERFLNPDRRTMPDLDIDFSDDGREKVIRYVMEKYGKGSVAQIITFGSMLARLVVRDVGRVMEIPLPECDRIAKMIPKEPGITIAHALKQVPELKALYRSNEQVQRLLDISQRLEGLKRHTGVHAAGTVIVPAHDGGDITDIVPLSKGAKDVVTTQYNDESLLKLGVLKIDFLGLRTLTVLNHAEKLVRERHDPAFDLSKITLEDPKTFSLLEESRTQGVFQLESSGMRDLLRKLKPSSLEDIIALISLYRPGPMGSGMLNDFVSRKHARTKVRYDHPVLEPILKETYGIIVYQEQVMKISQALAGFTPGQADVLRKAMGKKIPEEITKLRAAFLEGAKKNRVDHKTAEKVFEQMEHFGGYGFNKSHATAYGLLAYQTAHLKANYPPEYMASLISSVIGHSSVAREEGTKMVEYIEDAKSMGIEVVPPDVQSSGMQFTLSGTGEGTRIIFGLQAVKNVGEGAVEEILRAARTGPFLSFEDFCQRVDTRTVNRKVLESLIKAGAFDFCGEPNTRVRSRLMRELETVMERTSAAREDRALGQGTLFSHQELHAPQAGPRPALAGSARAEDAPEWSEHELLSYEKEVLGFYVSGHPLAKFKDELKAYSTCDLGHLPSNGNGRLRVAGIIANVRRLISKQHKSPYARFKLEDLEGEIDCVVFPKTYSQGLAERININQMVVVSGRLNTNQIGEKAGDELIVEEIYPLEKARETLVRKMLVELSTAGLEERVVEKLKKVLAEHPGPCPVQFVLRTPSHGDFAMDPGIKIRPNRDLLADLGKILGDNSWKLLTRNPS